MDEARAVLARLDRIEELEREGAPPGVLLEELRGLVQAAGTWGKLAGGGRARTAGRHSEAGAVAAGAGARWKRAAASVVRWPPRCRPSAVPPAAGKRARLASSWSRASSRRHPTPTALPRGASTRCPAPRR